MRRLLTASLGLCTVLSAHAALLNNSPDHVLVPCFKGGFEFGLTGAYMRSDYHKVDYALRDTDFNYVVDGKYLDIDSEYHFAWGAMIGWRFANTANDLRLSYFDLNSDDSNSAKTTESSHLQRVVGVDNNYWFTGGGYHLESARGKNEFDVSAIDLEFGQHIDVGCHTSMRFFVGVSHHDVEKDTVITYSGSRQIGESPLYLMSEVVKKRSEFEGWGPRLGFDSQYAFNNGFGLVGHFSTAFFFGELDSSVSAQQRDVNSEEEATVGFGPQDAKVKIRSRHIVVPNVDLRLGLDYSYAFDGGSIVTTEVGYWGKTYFGGVNDTDLGVTRHASQLDNVTFHGAYLSLIAHL